MRKLELNYESDLGNNGSFTQFKVIGNATFGTIEHRKPGYEKVEVHADVKYLRQLHEVLSDYLTVVDKFKNL